MTVNADMLEIDGAEIGGKSRKKIFVGFALDRSGSMMDIRKETISGVNEQIDDIKASAKNADVSVSMLTFASRGEWQYYNEPIDRLEKLSIENYIPEGSTAMFEGVGMLMNRLNDETKDLDKDDYSVLLIVISDGQNNVNSVEYNPKKISEKVKELQKGGNWTFTYIGANQDLTKVQEDLGISKGNIMSFVATSAGTHQGFADQNSLHRNSLRSYVTTASSRGPQGMMATSNFYGSGDAANKAESIQNLAESQKVLQKEKEIIEKLKDIVS